MKRKNGGFSLIELIVVIAIMAILASVVAISVGTLGVNDARTGASNINAAVSRIRTLCMGRQSEVYLVLEKDAETDKIMGLFYENDTLIDTRELCSPRVLVTCNSQRIDSASDVDGRTISFDRETGALKLPEGSYAASNPPYCLIRVVGSGSENGSDSVYAVQIYCETGSHSVLSPQKTEAASEDTSGGGGQ